MAYLLHSFNTFYVIDSSAKSGLYCQIFSPNSPPRSHCLHPTPITQYSACLSKQHLLYIALMTDSSCIRLISYKDGHYTKKNLVTAQTENYTLSSPLLYAVENDIYLIYLSYQPSTKVFSFVHQSIYSESLTTLMTTPIKPESIHYFTYHSNLYLFYTCISNSYQLNCLKITPDSTEHITYLHSPFPILDYSVYMEQQGCHICYVIEKHGKYQLSYINSLTQKPQDLVTTPTPSVPCIFTYHDGLWINAVIENTLHLFLSIDQGETFSMAVPSSLQHHIKCYHFTTSSHENTLNANKLYASITNVLKLCLIYAIDFEAMHPDSFVSPELQLLIAGLSLKLSQKPVLSSPSSEVSSLKSTTIPQTDIPINENSLNAAKQSFMDSLTTWELPPLK